MSKKRSDGKDGSALSEEVQNLIARKLRHRKREREKLVVAANQAAYLKLREQVLADIKIRNYRKALTSVPLAIYREIVASATAMTQQWPGVVWETIEGILSAANVSPRDGAVIDKIVDEFAWAIDQKPFTLSYVDPERFIGVVRREAGRYGIDRQDDLMALKSQMDGAAEAQQAGVLDTARLARVGVGIAIDKYLLAQRHKAASTTPNTLVTSTTQNEIRKQRTRKQYQAWQKEYRALKRKQPKMFDFWYARQIAKKAIANGRDADTIRKHMKK